MTDQIIFNVWPTPAQVFTGLDLKSGAMEITSWESVGLLTGPWGEPVRALVVNGWWSNVPERSVREWQIEQDDLPEGEPYQVVDSIPVTVRSESDMEFEASIPNANLAATGISLKDAFTNLVCEMLDAFDYLKAHQAELGPGPLRQWNYLRGRLVKTHD